LQNLGLNKVLGDFPKRHIPFASRLLSRNGPDYDVLPMHLWSEGDPWEEIGAARGSHFSLMDL
jgi:hypothetical protein